MKTSNKQRAGKSFFARRIHSAMLKPVNHLTFCIRCGNSGIATNLARKSRVCDECVGRAS